MPQLKKHVVPLLRANAPEALTARPVVTVVVVNIVIRVGNVELALQKKHHHQRRNLSLRKHQVSAWQLQKNEQGVVELHSQAVLIVGSINFQC